MNKLKTLNINSIKKDAKKYTRNHPHLKHTEALSIVSREKYGFVNYKHALNYLSRLDKSEYLMTVGASWMDGNKNIEFEYCSIVLSKSWENICNFSELKAYRYSKEAIIDNGIFTLVNRFLSQNEAREAIRRILKAYQFMDVTGFKPIHISSTSYPESYYGYGVKMRGVDHLCIWKEPTSDLHFFTNEPYRDMEKADLQLLFKEENLTFKECCWKGIYHSYNDLLTSSKLYLGTNADPQVLEFYLEKINELENLLVNFHSWEITDSCFYSKPFK